jgi:hypothetical protein
MSHCPELRRTVLGVAIKARRHPTERLQATGKAAPQKLPFYQLLLYRPKQLKPNHKPDFVGFDPEFFWKR